MVTNINANPKIGFSQPVVKNSIPGTPKSKINLSSTIKTKTINKSPMRNVFQSSNYNSARSKQSAGGESHTGSVHQNVEPENSTRLENSRNAIEKIAGGSVDDS